MFLASTHHFNGTAWPLDLTSMTINSFATSIAVSSGGGGKKSCAGVCGKIWEGVIETINGRFGELIMKGDDEEHGGNENFNINGIFSRRNCQLLYLAFANLRDASEDGTTDDDHGDISKDQREKILISLLAALSKITTSGGNFSNLPICVTDALARVFVLLGDLLQIYLYPDLEIYARNLLHSHFLSLPHSDSSALSGYNERDLRTFMSVGIRTPLTTTPSLSYPLRERSLSGIPKEIRESERVLRPFVKLGMETAKRDCGYLMMTSFNASVFSGKMFYKKETVVKVESK